MWSTLFPPICLGCERLLRHDRPLALCSRCGPEQARLPDPLCEQQGIRAIWAYDGPLRRAVSAMKFAGAQALAGPLGRLLAQDPRLRTNADGAAWDIAVAVPLHWRRRLLRGFDQSQALLHWALEHAAGDGAPLPTPSRPLRRLRATRPQSSLDADDRQANVHRAFAVIRASSIEGRRVLLVDDVATTGATLAACRAVLLDAGAVEVGALALLRAESSAPQTSGPPADDHPSR
ncbi:MAG: ComF family protein [Myxococcales bacterium]|nr:ComF family protein [Myxococcales bacterium]